MKKTSQKKKKKTPQVLSFRKLLSDTHGDLGEPELEEPPEESEEFECQEDTLRVEVCSVCKCSNRAVFHHGDGWHFCFACHSLMQKGKILLISEGRKGQLTLIRHSKMLVHDPNDSQGKPLQVLKTRRDSIPQCVVRACHQQAHHCLENPRLQLCEECYKLAQKGKLVEVYQSEEGFILVCASDVSIYKIPKP